MTNKPILPVLALLALTALAGCARPDPLELPELSLVNMRLSDVKMFETEAIFEVRIANVGPEPLRLDGGAVHIYLEGLKVGKGMIAGPLDVPRFDSVTVELPVYINNLTVATRLKPIIESKQLSYRIKGVLYELTGSGTRKLRTEQEGEFDFRSRAELPVEPE